MIATLALLFLLVGIVFILMGYIDLSSKLKSVDKKIEYRFLPGDVYDQIESNNLDEQFGFMFKANDPRFKTNLV
jgi:hypothetical protein